jgi:tRNA-2-methylthio-N6-dimethylallyladenosine synthase
VGSYRDRRDGQTRRLADLLYLLHDIEGLARLKFVTNHPTDMTNDLLDAVRDLRKCSPYLHVPAQSGSNAVLARMKRGYTVESYIDMLVRTRARVPGAAITSDFIVGFCGETAADFAQTCKLVREAQFKNSFIFKYSARRGTKAAERFPDNVAEAVKRRRNQQLLAIQNAISLEHNRRLIGRVVEVLVEGPSKMSRTRHEQGYTLQLTGRTPCDRIVVLDGDRRLIGRIVPVIIRDATAVTLLAAVPTQNVDPELHALTTHGHRPSPPLP